ncbi:NADPH:quinone oxidoreductase family protein [Aminobacter sp. LjRoot7]|uniref:NADPH:quinone oxidoreductase family protein n=1 Tax=Aminobacter sp. LjRoot7 TaxID=3342335 RepID=UPI003ECC23B2
MKAVVCNRLGDPSVLEIEERPSHPAGAGEVRVKLKAAALNFPDILQIAGGYQVKPDLPFIPGIEAAGEIVEIGPDVASWKVGDRVIVTGAAEPLGLFAEEVTAPLSALTAIPKGMSYEAASGYLATYATSYHALVDRGRIRKGETLVVHGATGGVGTAAVQIGKHLGARVIATGGSDEKLAVVKAMGADHVINYSTEDIRERVKELTGGKGADIIYDPVGGPVFEASMRCIALEGRILIIGATSGTYAPVKTNHILIKEVEIVGVLHGNWRGRHPDLFDENMRILGQWAEAGHIAPHVGRTYPLEKAADALTALANREIVGKCVLSIN